MPVVTAETTFLETRGTLADTLRLNLNLRTAHRVLFRMKSFSAGTPDDLYRKVKALKWETYLSEDGYFSVHSFVDNPQIRDSRFANVKCKDAVADRIRNVCGRRPDSGPDRTRATIFLYWKGEACSVYLDTSGTALSHRGYRKIPFKAPLREATAAAAVMAGGWDGTGSFINPMCGSGTLAIEAALIALGRAPGLLRNNFGFMHIKGFEKSSWDALRKETRKTSKRSFEGRILATDISEKAVEAARKNAATAGVENRIEFRTCGYEETPVPEGGGVVMINPEYGERLGKTKELVSVYKGIGDFFKNSCCGYSGYIFTGNLELAKKVGLKAKKRHIFFNGNIECRLLAYDLYEGSRRSPEKQEQSPETNTIKTEPSS